MYFNISLHVCFLLNFLNIAVLDPQSHTSANLVISVGHRSNDITFEVAVMLVLAGRVMDRPCSDSILVGGCDQKVAVDIGEPLFSEIVSVREQNQNMTPIINRWIVPIG